jgi:hypothetical protein
MIHTVQATENIIATARKRHSHSPIFVVPMVHGEFTIETEIP